MYKLITNDTEGTALEVTQSLDELAREGARRMIAQALQFEVDEYIEKLSHLRNERGNALVVRNGKGQERTLTMGAGAIKIEAPRVNDQQQDPTSLHASFTAAGRSYPGPVPARSLNG